MRLSDVKGERTLDVLADLVEPLANIAEDEDAAALFRRERLPEGLKPHEFFALRIKRSIPALLKKHRKDIVAVMATIEGVTPEEYTEKLSLSSLLKDLYEMLTDEELLAFLSTASTPKGKSGLASESTEGQKAHMHSSDISEQESKQTTTKESSGSM